MTTTFEVKLRTSASVELRQWLVEQDYPDFVEASCDDLNVDEADGAAVIDGLLVADEDLPITYYFDSEAAMTPFLNRLESFSPPLTIETKSYPTRLWQEAWEETESNYRIGQLEVLVSFADDYQPEPQQILMRSGGAFGSGQHATTKAILRMLVSIAEKRQGSLLDIGSGTGILAIAAEKLGFDRVVATDIDGQAISSAKVNRALNHSTFDLIFASLPENRELFDVIVSNILPPVVTDLIPDFVSRLRPGGLLVLAGFTAANHAEVLARAAANGLQLISSESERSWLAHCFRI